MKNKNQSFTLIEILIVIVLVGIISSLVIILLTNVVNSARDAQRKHDITSFQQALLSYKFSSGLYPIEATQCNIGTNCNDLLAALVPEYFKDLPTDPNPATPYQYVSTTGNDFTIQSTLSNFYTYGYSSNSGFFLITSINGVCGSSNGGSFASPPSSNLCAVGTPSAVTTNTQPDYIWSCSGIEEGDPVNCSANIVKTSPCPILGDADEDNYVTKNDLIVTYNYVNITPYPPGADVNATAYVDYDDVVQVYQYLIGGQSSFSGCP